MWTLDLNSNKKEYKMYLCKANKDIVGEIPEYMLDEIFIGIEGGESKISLTIPYMIKDEMTKKMVKNPIYHKITKSKKILVNDEYYFAIDGDEERDEGEKAYKKLTCYALEKKQLEGHKITLDGAVRQIYSDNVNISEGIFNWLEQQTSWKLGYLDTEAKVENITGIQSNKYRWFEPLQKSWLQFLKEDVCKAFDIILIFNSKNKTIDVWNRKNFGENRGLYLSCDNFIKGINKKKITENMVTRLVIHGKDGLSIAPSNPLGTDYIENFNYFKTVNSDNELEMSTELISALDKYEILLNEKYVLWLTKKEAKDVLNQKKIELNSKLTAKQEEIHGLNSYLSAYVTTKDSVNTTKMKALIDKVQAEIDSIVSQLGTIANQMKALDGEIAVINSSIDKTKAKDKNGNLIFDAELLEELDEFIVEDEYTNEFYLTSEALYVASNTELEERIKPTIEFSIEVSDFVKSIKHPQGWKKLLRIGDFVTCYSKVFGEFESRIVGITHNPKDNKLTLTLSNKEKRYKEFGSVGSSTKKGVDAKAVLDFYKHIYLDGQVGSNWVRDLLDKGLTGYANMIRGQSTKNKFRLDETGAWFIDAENENNQCYLGASIYSLTEDGWKTCKTAITPSGVMAEAIIGKVLLGEKLYIANESGNFVIDGNGLTVKDELGRVRVKLGIFNGIAGLQLFDKSGNEVILDENGMLNHYQFPYVDELDAEHPIILPLFVDEGVKALRTVKMYLRFEPFRATSKGTTSGGGSYPTTESAGYTSSTSSTNGGGTYTTYAGGYYDASGVSQRWGNPNYVDSFSNVLYFLQYTNTGQQGISVKYDDFKHTHPIEVPSHRHDVYIDNHSHGFTIDSHYHNCKILDHDHGMAYGIFEDSRPSNVNVYVNDVLVNPSPLNGDITLDITNFLKLNSTNLLKITSASRGRIVSNFFFKAFVSH